MLKDSGQPVKAMAILFCDDLSTTVGWPSALGISPLQSAPASGKKLENLVKSQLGYSSKNIYVGKHSAG